MSEASRSRVPGVLKETVRAYSPGRVNLIGDHTDYNDGLALPMAIDMGTTVTYRPEETTRLIATSSHEPDAAEIDIQERLDADELRRLEPPWARFVAALVSILRPTTGGSVRVESSLPIGAGLSSSAALEVSLALALGSRAEPHEIAGICQHAEHLATGVMSGPMDQLTVAGGRQGSALVVDFADLSFRHVPIPEGAEILVVHSEESRTLPESGYAARVDECRRAEAALGRGPLGRLGRSDIEDIADPFLRSRARHVVSECERVRRCVGALESGDLKEAGRAMTESHRSLAVDFEVSTPALDGLVDELASKRGVFGARLTGAGFGGCVVALTARDAIDVDAIRQSAWAVRPSTGAQVLPPE